MITRREALRQGVMGAAMLCSLETPSTVRPVARTSASARAAQANPFEPFRAELPLPPVLRPVRRTLSTDYYVITQREALANILPGYQTPIFGYDGLYPGPTIRARKNRRVVVRQVNALGREVNVHLHGGKVPWRDDGHPSLGIPAGAARVYGYPNRQDAFTGWYHDHVHHASAEQIYRGLAAFYLLHDELEEDLDLPRGRYDVPLMIQDKSFNQDGSLRYARDVNTGFLGDTILVNGAVAPRLAVARRRYRLRLLNASNARQYELALSDGSAMTQIASDGGLLPRPLRRTNITIGPAERIDVVVDFAEARAGAEIVLRNMIGGGARGVVMRFDVARRRSSEDFRVPRRLRPLERIPAPRVTRTVSLDQVTQPMVEWRLNGKPFDPARIDYRPRFGSTETWRFRNTTTMTHPMHVHGFFFRVVARGSRRPPAHERGWKDVVRVLAGETVTVQPHFGGYRGRYVFHCHVLEHGDQSMMGQMEVVS